MGILDKLAQAKEATGSSGGRSRTFINKSGLWVNLEDGDNPVRLGGNLAVGERHYVVDLVNADALKPQGEERAAVGKNLTCLNWDIDKQERTSEELHCCAICDLRAAANMRRREAKEAKNKELEDKMKDLSGKAYARSRYSWDAISRADTLVKTTDADGNETEAPGWKILNLGTEGTEAIEALAKQYPQITDPDEGCDVVISKHKSNRITYGASFALDGPNIKISPLTDEEKEMEPVDLLRYIASHASPRAVFESLKPAHQELITEVLGKSAEDYPSEAPVKKTIRNDDGESSSESEAPVCSASIAPKAPVRKRAANVADEFEDVNAEDSAKNDTFTEEKAEEKVEEVAQEENKPSLPKKPAPPKKPAAPKPPAKPEKAADPEPKEEAVEEKKEEKEEEKPTEKKKAAAVKPACFGSYEENDGECQKCKASEECRSEA